MTCDSSTMLDCHILARSYSTHKQSTRSKEPATSQKYFTVCTELPAAPRACACRQRIAHVVAPSFRATSTNAQLQITRAGTPRAWATGMQTPPLQMCGTAYTLRLLTVVRHAPRSLRCSTRGSLFTAQVKPRSSGSVASTCGMRRRVGEALPECHSAAPACDSPTARRHLCTRCPICRSSSSPAAHATDQHRAPGPSKYKRVSCAWAQQYNQSSVIALSLQAIQRAIQR